MVLELENGVRGGGEGCQVGAKGVHVLLEFDQTLLKTCWL